MMGFFHRLLGIEGNCSACKVYEKWNHDLQAELEQLHGALNEIQERVINERNLERLDRKELQEVILDFTRLKRVEKQPEPAPPTPKPQPVTVRQGQTWSAMKADLEAQARKKAEYYRNLGNDQIRAGRLSPDVPEDLRELEKNAKQGERGAQ